MSRKVYLASEGAYSDYQIVGAFTRREDAEKYVADGMADGVEEFELHDGPVEVVEIHRYRWFPSRLEAPYFDHTRAVERSKHPERLKAVWHDGTPMIDRWFEVSGEDWDEVHDRVNEEVGRYYEGRIPPW